ncbi:hypothetical protein Ciccas_012862 [Cichlidogyrus casuarinus]|uniref:Uncharacterized protein n=1 Tax=Cichlidogyrus casuarinus TaxID=1844966 RepID=A0ABD2PNY8_9PLAT
MNHDDDEAVVEEQLDKVKHSRINNSNLLEFMITYQKACWEGSVKTLKYVKKNHYALALIEVNKIDKNGLAPIHYAAKYDKYKCLRFLSKYFKASESSIHW